MSTPLHPALPLIPRRVLFGDPERVSPAICPLGRRLAWLAPDDGVLNVWVRNLHGPPGSARPVTTDRDRGVHQFRWSPDGTRILHLQDDGGDENYRLRDVHLDTGAERDLTPKGARAYISKISKRFPEDILLGLNLDRPQLHDIYRLHLPTGELVKVCDNPGLVGLVADEQLRVRAGMAPLPDGGIAIVVRDDELGDWRPLVAVRHEDALSTAPAAFSADGSQLLCLTSAGAEAVALVWFDLATGERDVVAADPGYDVTDVAVHIDTNEPRVVFIQRERRDPVVVDPTVGSDITHLGALDGGDLHLLGSDHADTTWLVSTVHDTAPTRYYTYDRAASAATFQFASQPALQQHTLAAMEPFRITSRDGLNLYGYLTFPPSAQRRDLPAVVNVHGGPWHRDTWGYDPEAQWLANRGYLCIQVNFRGSTGYGKAFLNAGNRQWAAKMHDDLLDALAWTVQQGWVDPDRVAIYGHSYGGYASLVGAAFTPEVFRCAVAVAGSGNIKTLIEAIPPYYQPMIVQAHTRIGDPATEADLLWSRSPLSRVHDIRIPVLIAQGGNDPRVPQSESEQIVDALRRNGIPHEYLLFPDEGHGLVKPDNRLRFYAAAEAFLAEHLGGRAEDHT